ncbi:hypothetical protein KOR42_43030 [Thalassoglobus neptunius]|uniref:Uncharacterized protein n=2 Tax=Thalassoglobus neptunius TaxID=1938619 RepID=A0A5C5WA79_9PLAN|nr:hypothetical protein KOR42_43030 [Thalassoglobus neptunius]
MMISTIVFLTILTAGFALMYWMSPTGFLAKAYPIVLTVFAFFLGAILLFFHGIALILVGWAGRSWRFNPLVVCVFAFASLVGIVSVVGWGYSMSASARAEVREMRDAYPFESLADRLPDPAKLNALPESNLAPQVVVRLSKKDDMYRGSRASTLKRLHSEYYEDFVTAAGFGPVRMVRIQPRMVELPEPKPIPQSKLHCPKAIEESKNSSSDGWSYSGEREFQAYLQTVTDPRMKIHETSESEFLRPNTFGYVQDHEHVAGFQSHAFARVPVVDEETPELAEWRLERIELVGLLRNDEPVVYLSESLPNLEELDTFETRPVDGWEADALSQLVDSTDLVVREQPQEIRMIGSLRASNNCLMCHDVRRGQVLGALAYTLTRSAESESASDLHEETSPDSGESEIRDIFSDTLNESEMF